MKKKGDGDGCPLHSTDSIDRFDMLDEEARANPWIYYDWLRKEPNRRVYKLEFEEDFYVIHRHEDVKRAFLASRQLSSKIIPTKESLFIALLDGEDHRRIRSVLAGFFSPHKIDPLIPNLEALIKDSTMTTAQGQSFELLTSWAIPITMKMLSSLLGLPTNDAYAKGLYDKALAINKALFVTGGVGPRRPNQPSFTEKFHISQSIVNNTPKLLKLYRLIGKKGMLELKNKLRVTDRTLNVPRPTYEAIPLAIGPFLDLLCEVAVLLNDGEQSENFALSHMKKAIRDDHVTKVEMLLASAFIVFAGQETTISLLSNCIIHLAENPSEFQNLKQNQEFIDNYIQECLRYYTPVGRFLRRATEDVQLAGQLIPKDALLILMSGAANTDSHEFEMGCRFDIHRKNPSQHLSFGKGAHYCLGAYLAKIVTRMALKQWLGQIDTFELDKSKPTKLVTDRDNGVYRYEEVWLSVS